MSKFIRMMLDWLSLFISSSLETAERIITDLEKVPSNQEGLYQIFMDNEIKEHLFIPS